MKTNYLLYFCDGIGSVFDSQVLALLKVINESNTFKKTYLFLGIRNKIQRNVLKAGKLPSEIKTVFFKTYPNYPVFNFMIRNSIQNALLNQSINLNEAIFHTRGEMIAWHLSKILDINYYKNIIPDVRGASVEEIEEFTDINPFSKALKIANYKKALRNLNNFRHISVVSDSLKDYLNVNYKIDRNKIYVTPSLAGKNFRFNEVERLRLRNELNLKSDDKLIVFSSGGTANWQNNDVILRLAEKGLKVLNLSQKEINHKNVINKFVSYSEIPAYLNAADAAIIWRHKSVVNKVASPVKFSEYICCGLPVIANNSVSMISEYIQRHDCGLLIDNLANIYSKTISDLRQKEHKKISESGILNFGVDTIVNKYLQAYLSINSL